MYTLVAAGSASGALVRWAALSTAGESFETVSTVILNGLGSLILGLIIGSKQSKPIHRAVGVGFCGGATTFSSFAVQIAMHLDDGHLIEAIFLLVSTAAFAIVLAWVGYNVGRERSNA